jgi:hypothetical protein
MLSHDPYGFNEPKCRPAVIREESSSSVRGRTTASHGRTPRCDLLRHFAIFLNKPTISAVNRGTGFEIALAGPFDHV